LVGGTFIIIVNVVGGYLGGVHGRDYDDDDV
jgi:hypothetical protein